MSKLTKNEEVEPGLTIVNKTGMTDDTEILDRHGNNLVPELGVESIDIHIGPHDLLMATLTCYVNSLHFEQMDAVTKENRCIYGSEGACTRYKSKYKECCGLDSCIYVEKYIKK